MMDYKLVLVFFLPSWHNLTPNSNKPEVTEPRQCPLSSRQHQSSVFAELSFTSKTEQDLFFAHYCLAVLCSIEFIPSAMNRDRDKLFRGQMNQLLSGVNKLFLTLCTISESYQTSFWPQKSNKQVNQPLMCCLIFQVNDTWEAPLSSSSCLPQQCARAPAGVEGLLLGLQELHFLWSGTAKWCSCRGNDPHLKGLSLGILGYSVRKFHGCFWQRVSGASLTSPLSCVDGRALGRSERPLGPTEHRQSSATESSSSTVSVWMIGRLTGL